MAIRTNCIEYGWETTGSMILSASTFTSAAKKIYIPETASRVFTDVIFQFHGRNNGLESSTTPGIYSMSIQIDNQPSQSYITSGFNNQTNEQLSWFYFFSGSDYFNTYFTASSHNVTFQFNSALTNTIGHSFKLISTYQFDDSTVNQSIKTVRFPINSITASSLSTTMVYLGNQTSSIPPLDSYLPESNKTYRDIFVEYHSNDLAGSTANFELRTKIDTAASASRFTVSQSLQSSAYYYEIQNLSGSIDTSTTHSIQVASTVASRLNCLCGILHCTYEYDYTGSSRIMNSNVYSLANGSIYSPTRANSTRTFYRKNIYIPESGSITLAKSGVMFSYGGSAPRPVEIGIDSSSFVVYSPSSAGLQTGVVPVIHQIDGTGSHAPSIVLSNGYNDLKIYARIQTEGAAGGATFYGGLLYLNYISDRTSSPLGHTHTIYELPCSNAHFGNGSTTFFYNTYAASSSLADVSYFISDVTNVYHWFFGVTTNTPIYNIFESVCYYTGSDFYYDAPENPFKIGSNAQSNDARANYVWTICDMTPFVYKYAGYQPLRNNAKINLRTNHDYSHRYLSVSVTPAPTLSHLQVLTYHSITFAITGSILNYSGSGANIPLTIYDYDSGAKLFTTQSKSGGIIDTYWYDGHTNLMIIASTGSGYVSNILPAGNSGSFIITIPTSSAAIAGGEKSFTFIG